MTVNDLRESGRFELVDTIEQEATLAWLRRYLFSAGAITVPFWLLNAALLGIVAAVWSRAGLPAIDAFSMLAMGMCGGYVVLLPVHEYVHAAAYRLMGAPSARVHYLLRDLTAFCTAPDYVMTGHQFLFVALAPFVVVNAGLVAMASLAPPGAPALAAIGALLLHVGACSGDIAFVEYVWRHRSAPLYTYDEGQSLRMHFYRERSSA